MLERKSWDWIELPVKMPPDDNNKSSLGSDETLYASIQEFREEEWRKVVLAFEENQSVYNAYWYVALHPMFYFFMPPFKDGRAPRVHERHLVHEQGWQQVQIQPHLVNPATMRISDDPSLNTHTEFWYEFGPTLFGHDAGAGISGHDQECDDGAKSYDDAIVAVAKKIHEVYGNDREAVVEKWNDVPLPAGDEAHQEQP